MQQKLKIHWLQCGDGNDRFFHASLRSRRSSGILVLYDSAGQQLIEESSIKKEVLVFYKNLLGSPTDTDVC